MPKGFAHGFQTLADNAEIVYQTSEFYAPDAAGGYRYDEVPFDIAWPLPSQWLASAISAGQRLTPVPRSSRRPNFSARRNGR